MGTADRMEHRLTLCMGHGVYTITQAQASNIHENGDIAYDTQRQGPYPSP